MKRRRGGRRNRNRGGQLLTGLRFERLEDRRLLEGMPLITELMADNISTLYSESLSDYPDWCEIYNSGPGPVDLQDWYLTDDKDELHRWQFGSPCILPEDEFLVVFASGSDLISPTPEGEWHTSFRLRARGEYLALVKPDGTTIISEYEFPEQLPDVSYGLTAGFDDETYFTRPTPGERNPPSFRASVFSPQHGFCDTPILVALDTSALAGPIYFTTDGSAPTPGDSLYDGGIPVDATTTLRVRAFGPAAEPIVYTQTYIFASDVLGQPAAPAGFPATWQSADGSSVVADYEMDPEVVTDPAYSASLVDGLLAIPTVSIAMEPDDLFGSATGIYANPLESGGLWERAASVEMIYPDGRETFQVDAGIRIQGGDSREPANSPKHSLRLRFSSDYGPTKLDYPLFEQSDVQRFDNLVLRAGYDDSWISPDAAGREGAVLARDQWVRHTHLAMGQPATCGLFVHLYLNGLYWGLYELTERIDDNFGENHFGGQDDDYDVIDSGELADGNLDAWNALIGIATAGVESDAAYQQIQQYLDMASFIDFMVLNIFAGKVDLADGNWYAMRNRDRGEPFQFYCWDSEQALHAIGEDQSEVEGANSPAFLYARLRENAEFRRSFGDRLHYHFANGGALITQATVDRWQQMVDPLGEAVVLESARWGDYRRDVDPYESGPYALYARNAHWLGESQRLLEDYLPQRSDVVLNQFRLAGLYPSVAAPTFSQHGGLIDPDSELAVTAPEGAIYYTLDGSDPWLLGVGVDPCASLYTGPISLAEDTIVKARVFHDEQWSALCQATFFEPVPLQITELQYRALDDEDPASPYSGGDFDFIELTNVGPDPLDLTGLTFTAGIFFDFAGGDVSVLAPGERVVVASVLNAFGGRYDTAEMLIAGAFDGRLRNSGERITLRGSLGQPIIDFVFDDDWYDITDGDGFSLVARHVGDVSADCGDYQSWRPSHYVGGSPGVADPGYNPGDIVISETLTHNDGSPGDWIELYNTTDEDIDISGWYLSDSSDLTMYQIQAGNVLPAGDYLVFSADEHFGESGLPGVNVAFKINKLGDTLRLTSAAADGSLGGYREVVSFGYGFNPVAFIRYTNSTGDIDIVATSQNTPGEPNAKPMVGYTNAWGVIYKSSVISEIMYHPAGDGDEYIELYNPHSEPAELFGPFVDEDTWRFTDGVFYNFPLEVTIAPDGYVLVVGIDPEEFRVKYNVPAETLVFGPYFGELLNSGERLVLARPVDRASFVPYSMADQVVYNGNGDWPVEANGLGSSLNRRFFTEYGNDVLNWTAGIPGGTPGRSNVDAHPTEVLGRHVFYDNSSWDDPSSAPDRNDDTAIAADKCALMPGEMATFDNYTNYVRGINGVMIDVANLPSDGEALDVNEHFEFRVGNDGDPAGWDLLGVWPALSVRPGEGVEDSDRVTLIWPEGAIRNGWLQVTVRAALGTGLVEPETFCFGNAVADVGDSTANTRVDANDILETRNHPQTFFDPAGIDCAYDFNRDGRVDTHDVLIARNNQTAFFDELVLIDLSEGKAVAGIPSDSVPSDGVPSDGVPSDGGRTPLHDAALGGRPATGDTSPRPPWLDPGLLDQLVALRHRRARPATSAQPARDHPADLVLMLASGRMDL